MADSKESPSAFEKSLNDAVQKALANTEPLQVESKSYEKVPATALKSRLRDRKSHRTMMKLEKKQRRVRGKEEFREDHKPPQFIFEDGGIGSLGTSSVGNDSGNNPLPQIHIPDSGSVRSANSRKAYGLTRQMQDAVSVGSRGKKKEQAPLPPGLQFGAPSISNASELPKDLDAYVQRVSGRGAFVGDEENPNGSLLRKQSPYQTSSYPGEDFYTWNRHNVNQTRKRNAYIAGGTLIAVLILAVTLGVTISDTEGGSVSAEASRSESDIVSGRTVPLYPSLPTPPDFVGKSLPRTNDIWTKESLQGMLEAFAHSNHLEDSSTPQGKSFSWLLEKDDLKGLSSTRVQQRYALASIFYASQTQKWKNQYGWLTKSHECSWFGVKCGNDGYSFDNTSGDLTDVITYINLKDNNMEGSLPQEFNLFPKLAQLNLAENFFTGSVPSDLFLKFHKMHAIYLNGNLLEGDIPDEFNHMLALEVLDLSYNSFQGTIPPTLSFARTLRDLRIGNNELTGQITDIFGGMKSLETFIAGNNELEGPVPKEIGLLPKLSTVQLYENKLTGNIPDFASTKLQLVHFDSNGFTGPIPFFEAEVPLEQLRLERNKLDGNLPIRLGDHIQLKVLHLSENNFSGYLPHEYGRLEQLTSLKLEGNSLSGDVPSSVCDLVFDHFLMSFSPKCDGSNSKLEHCECCSTTC